MDSNPRQHCAWLLGTTTHAYTNSAVPSCCFIVASHVHDFCYDSIVIHVDALLTSHDVIGNKPSV